MMTLVICTVAIPSWPFPPRYACCWKSILLQVDGTLHDALTPVTLHIFANKHMYTPRRMFTHHHPVSLIYLISSHPISYHLILSIESIYISACVMLYLVDCDLPKLWRCMCQSLADNCCVQGAIHKNGDSEYPVAARGDHHIFTLTFIETQGCYWQAKKGASNHADSPIPFRSSRNSSMVFWRVTSLPALVLRHCNGLRRLSALWFKLKQLLEKYFGLQYLGSYRLIGTRSSMDWCRCALQQTVVRPLLRTKHKGTNGSRAVVGLPWLWQHRWLSLS